MIPTWKLLTYLGLLPLLLALLFETFFDSNSVISAKQAFVFYSAAILSFLSGTLWQKNNEGQTTPLNIASNVFCLYAFISLLLPIGFSIAVLSVGFLLLLLIEFLYFPSNKKADDEVYFRVRITATLGVVILHITALFLWHQH